MTNPGAPARFEIGRVIADERAAGEVEAKIPGGLQQHAGRGFAAFAPMPILRTSDVRMMRTIVDRVDPRAFPSQKCFDMGVNFPQVRFGKEPAGDPRLIGGDDDGNADAIEIGNGRCHSRYEHHLVDPIEVIDHFYDDPVAIEKHGGLFGFGRGCSARCNGRSDHLLRRKPLHGLAFACILAWPQGTEAA